VGAIHGGTKNNIIPDEVLMQLTVRSYKDEVRSTCWRPSSASRMRSGGGRRSEEAARRN